MYGNNFDYTGQQPDVDRDILQQIMDDTRNNTSQYTAQGFPDNDMGARLEAVGVGNVGDFLEEAYVPYIPTDTPSYAEFMSATPQNIANVIGATQTQYQIGRDARTKDFQSILNDVKKYTYGDDDAFSGASSSNSSPAIAEIEAVKSNPRLEVKRFEAQNRTPEESLANFTDQFGKSFGLNDYNRALKQGQDEEQLQDRLKKYFNYGANILPKVQDLGFLKSKSKVDKLGANWWAD